MRRAADARGEPCPLQNFDLNHFGKPDGWMDALSRVAATSMLDPIGFERRFQVPVTAVEGLAAAERAGAFRVLHDVECDSARGDVPARALASPAWNEAPGSLPAADCYFIELLSSGTRQPDSNLPRVVLARFLEQLPWVETLVTDAVFDTGLPSRGMVAAINELASNFAVPVSASYDGSTRGGEVRSGWLSVSYGPGSSAPEGTSDVQVRMPLYAESPHPVTTTEGPALREDVEAFLFGAPAGTAD